jgi:hypothetical protein
MQEVCPASRCLRFFVDPQLVTVLTDPLKRSVSNVVPTHSKPKASASEIEAALRVSLSATIKTRVIWRSA